MLIEVFSESLLNLDPPTLYYLNDLNKKEALTLHLSSPLRVGVSGEAHACPRDQ